jgi:putative ABC transport system ATP-binding protein
MNILEVKKLTKTYNNGHREITVLDHVNFSIKAGSTFSIVGPSGSGKTTLLGLCAGLDTSSEGSVILNGIEVQRLNEDERAEIRNKYVGFIFQNFQLIPTLTAIENVMVPLELRGDKNAFKQAKILLEKVGLGDRTSTILCSFPVENNKGFLWPGHFPISPKFYLPMSPLETWMMKPVKW